MWRTYLLLCSAVVLRLIGGLATVTGVAAPWVDPLATWMSWLVPLMAFESREWTRRKSGFFERDRPRARAAQGRRDPSVTYLEKWKWEVGQFFDGVGPDASDEELLAIAPEHPAFRIEDAA